MPSVSPLDGGSQSYQRTIGDLEDELQNEAKHSREREETRSKRLEENYRDALSKHDRELEDTVQDVKKNSERRVAQERSNARSEVEAAKKQRYDKSGRYIAERNEAQRQLEEQERASEARADRDRLRVNDARDNYADHSEELQKSYEGKLEKAIRDTRDSIVNSTGKTVEERNREYEDNRLDAQKRYEKMDRERIEDLNFQRRRFDKAYAESDRDHEHRTNGVIEAAQKTVEARRNDDLRRSEEDTKRMTESHAEETKQLRSQLKSVSDGEKEHSRGLAQGTSEAVAKYDDEWRGRQRATSEAYDREIVGLKDQARKTDAYFNHLNTESLRQKDAYFAKLLERQGLENHQREKQLEATFNGDREQIEGKMVTERRQSKQQLDSEMHDADRLRAAALEKQAKSYQDQMDRQRLSNRENTGKLEKNIRKLRTSPDSAEISPAAERAVRKNIMGEYEKQFGAERERNKRTAESMQREYSSRVRDTIERSVADKTRLSRTHAAEMNQVRAQFMNHVNDIKEDKDAALHHEESDFHRQTDASDRNNAHFIERQRRDYEEIIASQKDEADARIMSVRQQADFDLKMAQRTFSAKQNEIIRDYDKKLADQKQEYESRLDEMKGQNQQVVREADRKNRQALEEQQRIFDQRIAQLESQHKERERYITQNYQEDLEKVKRSNALLIQKKG